MNYYFGEMMSGIAESTNPEVERWFAVAMRDLAARVLVLADLSDDLDDQVRKLFPEVVRDLLSALPEGERVQLLPKVAARVLAVSPDREYSELCKSRLDVWSPGAKGTGTHRCVDLVGTTAPVGNLI